MKPNYSKLLFSVFALSIALFVFLNSCKKEETPQLPANPFENIDYGSTSAPIPPDPNSLVGIHTNILQPKCAIPGCHDGNFEPDFRTPQSAFSTLVYHPVVKNNATESFKFRVVPFKSAESVFYERITNCCFVNQDDRMPQDNIGVPLPDSDIAAIKAWIDNGAKDIGGNVPSYPNLEPIINPVFFVLDQATYKINYTDEKNRIDSVSYNPFLLPNNTDVVFAFLVEDDSTSYANMQVNQLKLSFDPDDFSNAQTLTASHVYIPPPEDINFYGITVNTSTLPKNKVVYMRYFVNDGDHIQNTNFPTDNLPLPYKTFWSFYVY